MSATAYGSGSSMIEAQGLSKYFGPFVAVRDISFSIPKGQIVAFLGPNGAGKTTLMRMLTGYLAPSAGGASIAGLDVRAQRIEASRRLGYLPENGPLYPDMTPLELLTFFGEARELGRALKTRIDAVVDLCALGLVIEKPIGRLSKGLKQRVGLAQALLHDPDVLIMDEPTAGLDPNQIRQFRENVQRLRATKTLLVSTHILHEAEATADRVLLVNGGRLVFDGTLAELEENGSIEEPFYRLTNRGAPEPPAPPPPVSVSEPASASAPEPPAPASESAAPASAPVPAPAPGPAPAPASEPPPPAAGVSVSTPVPEPAPPGRAAASKPASASKPSAPASGPAVASAPAPPSSAAPPAAASGPAPESGPAPGAAPASEPPAPASESSAAPEPPAPGAAASAGPAPARGHEQ